MATDSGGLIEIPQDVFNSFENYKHLLDNLPVHVAVQYQQGKPTQISYVNLEHDEVVD